MLLPHKALVVVADGVHAKFFRNAGQEGKVQLTAEGELKPHQEQGPAGAMPKDMPPKEVGEATFAKELANELYRRAHGGDFAALVLIADPQTLGEIRRSLHKEVQSRVLAELHKTLTKAPISEIEKALH